MLQGRILGGKYRLVDKLIQGGMGAVWRAEHLELGCPAAVKLLDPTIADSPEAVSRFKREAQSAASLRSTNIVQIFDFGVDDNTPYIAMELLRGRSLSDKLRVERILSSEDTATILSQVARATAWAHSRGIVHRDLKPGNIFLSEDADDVVVKLLDFGIAKPLELQVSDTPTTLTGSIMGTPQYMSPEQASGKRVLDHRTDIWSFAIIAFECLTGKHAFHADTLGGLVLAICTEPMPKPSEFGAVPVGFDEWFARCAHRDPDGRFNTIAQAAEALRRVCGVDATSSNRTISLEGTLSSEVRSNSTHFSGSAGSASDGRITDASSSNTLRDAPATERSGRVRALWIPVGLLVAGVAIGVIWHARYGEPAAEPTSAAARPASAAPAPTVASAVASGDPSPMSPMGIPTHATTVTAPPPTKPAKRLQKPLNSVTPSIASAPPHLPPAPAASTQCDPAVRNRIGFCPPTAK